MHAVTGMKCGGCVSRVKRILEGHSYVTQVHNATFTPHQPEALGA